MTRKLAILLALVSAMLALASLSACSGSAAAPASGSSSDAATATPPTLVLDQPKAGAELPAGDVKVSVTTTGLTFVMPSNTKKPGEGHVHFTLDDQPFKMSTKPEYVFAGVAPGPHKLKAELVQNDTKSFDPPVFQEIGFTAK